MLSNFWLEKGLMADVDGILFSEENSVDYVYYANRLIKRVHRLGPQVACDWLIVPVKVNGRKDVHLYQYPSEEDVAKARAKWNPAA